MPMAMSCKRVLSLAELRAGMESAVAAHDRPVNDMAISRPAMRATGNHHTMPVATRAARPRGPGTCRPEGRGRRRTGWSPACGPASRRSRRTGPAGRRRRGEPAGPPEHDQSDHHRRGQQPEHGDHVGRREEGRRPERGGPAPPAGRVMVPSLIGSLTDRRHGHGGAGRGSGPAIGHQVGPVGTGDHHVANVPTGRSVGQRRRSRRSRALPGGCGPRRARRPAPRWSCPPAPSRRRAVMASCSSVHSRRRSATSARSTWSARPAAYVPPRAEREEARPSPAGPPRGTRSWS